MLSKNHTRRMDLMVEVYCETNVVFLMGKKKFRRLYWKVRAEVRKQLNNNNNGRKHAISSSNNNKFRFHYDPLSYSLNFDDGYCGFFFC